MASLSVDIGQRRLSLADKLRGIQWGLVILIAAISGIGFAMLYSAANGSLQPWASRQMTRFAMAFVAMLIVALVDIRHWFRSAYWIYAVALVLVIAVDLRGFVGMGAQRWIDLGVIQLQPSEIMTIGLVLALARYFHCVPNENVGRISRLIPPVMMIMIPVALVLKQPDLGTAMLLLASGAILCFLGGVKLRMFALAAATAGIAAPIAWGFLLGTQTHLSFLPEKQTDFIFTMIAEEFGLVGGLILLGLYVVVIGYAFSIALRSRSLFGRLLGLGIAASFFLYAFINIAMVMGLIPVVGVPLPLISYGGTAMITMMLGFGLLMNVGVHRDVRISRRGESELG